MFFVQLIRYIKGYVEFTVEGKFLERFLNLVSRKNIPIWNTSKKANTFHGCTLVRHYKKIRPIVRKTHVSVKITEKYGLPFVLYRYRNRLGLLLGLGILIMAISCSGLFVWKIEVTGNNTLAANDIIDTMNQLGLTKGKLKSSLDVTQLAEELCIHYNEISWAAVNLIGTVAYVEIEERVMPPEIVDENTPCNVVAKKGGQICYMEVYEGEKVRKVGDTVKKGDIIVSGILEGKKGQTYVKHARAKVIGEYIETKEIYIPMEQTQLVPIGGVSNYKYIPLGKYKLPLSFGKKEEGFTRKYRRPAALFGFTLPFEVIVEQTVPAREETFHLTEEKAKRYAIGQLEIFENQLAQNGEIIERKIRGKIEQGQYILSAQYTYQQEIGKEEEILIEN